MAFLLRSPLKVDKSISVGAETNKRKAKQGFIYVVQLSEADNQFKVGFSTNPESRLKNYKTSNPTCSLIATMRVDEQKIEKLIHDHLASKFVRIKNSEVFKSNDKAEIVSAIKLRLSQLSD